MRNRGSQQVPKPAFVVRGCYLVNNAGRGALMVRGRCHKCLLMNMQQGKFGGANCHMLVRSDGFCQTRTALEIGAQGARSKQLHMFPARRKRSCAILQLMFQGPWTGCVYFYAWPVYDLLPLF